MSVSYNNNNNNNNNNNIRWWPVPWTNKVKSGCIFVVIYRSIAELCTYAHGMQRLHATRKITFPAITWMSYTCVHAHSCNMCTPFSLSYFQAFHISPVSGSEIWNGIPYKSQNVTGVVPCAIDAYTSQNVYEIGPHFSDLYCSMPCSISGKIYHGPRKRISTKM